MFWLSTDVISRILLENWCYNTNKLTSYSIYTEDTVETAPVGTVTLKSPLFYATLAKTKREHMLPCSSRTRNYTH